MIQQDLGFNITIDLLATLDLTKKINSQKETVSNRSDGINDCLLKIESLLYDVFNITMHYNPIKSFGKPVVGIDYPNRF